MTYRFHTKELKHQRFPETNIIKANKNAKHLLKFCDCNFILHLPFQKASYILSHFVEFEKAIHTKQKANDIAVRFLFIGLGVEKCEQFTFELSLNCSEYPQPQLKTFGAI